MRASLRIIVALVLLSSYPLVAKTKTQVKTKGQSKKHNLSVQEILNKMSLRQKIGQVFAFSFSGKETNKHTQHMIRTFNPGSLISFKRNISTPYKTYKLNRDLQSLSKRYSKLPLLIMLDQEGGRVTRIKTRYKTPSALSIGSTEDSKISFKAGHLTGKLVKTVGFNMNLAPVVDLSDPNKKNFIGNRSFGGEPSLVLNMGQEFSKGLWKNHVLPTYKHFPGHGGIIQDSHKKTPIKLSTLKELEETDLLPFLKLRNQDFPAAIMVAHVAFPNIDSSELPATFSKKLITDLLKNKYKFTGLIVTDDLEMSGAKTIGSLEERVKQSFLAGNDILMITGGYHKQKRAFNAIYRAVKSGEISMERLHETVTKIISHKLRIPKQRILSKKQITKEIKLVQRGLKKINDKVVKKQISKSLALQESLKNSIRRNEPLMLFSAYRSVYTNIKRTIKNKISFFPISKRSKINISAQLRKKPGRVALFYASGLGSLRRLNNVPRELKKNIIIINTTHPGSVKHREDYKAVVNINTLHNRSGEWIARQLVAPLKKRLPAASK